MREGTLQLHCYEETDIVYRRDTEVVRPVNLGRSRCPCLLYTDG